MTDPTQPINNKVSHRTSIVIQHIARNRLTTIDVLHRVMFPDMSRNAVAKMVTKLCERGELKKYTLRHPAQYFVLGELGARSVGMALHRTRPLGPQALPVEYAVLLHAMFSRPSRIRLTTQEVMTRYPWLPPQTRACCPLPRTWDGHPGIDTSRRWRCSRSCRQKVCRRYQCPPNLTRVSCNGCSKPVPAGGSHGDA